LNIETEFLEDQQIKITVEVDADQLEASKRKAAKKIARRIKIPGFRPGKAPYQVIRRQIGDEALLEESLEILVNEIYPKVIEETEIEPYGPGNLENVVSLDPMTLEFVIPLMAEVEIGDYQSIRLPYEPPEVTDQDIEAVELDFRQRQAIEETVDREAGVGDRLSLRLSAKRFEEDEDNEDSSEADLIEERSTSVIIANDQDDTGNEWPFSGFSRELVGMSTGDDKILVYTFPEDSPFETLRDVNAEFSIHIEDVKSRVLPELNDEFAQSLGEYEDLDALQKDIRESLEQRRLEAYNSEYDDQVIGQIVEGSTIKYPPQMKENEITNIIQQLESRLGNQGLDMDIYLKTREMDAQGLRDEAEPVADSRVKRSLVLLEIAQKEEIDISESELQEETTRTLASITRFMSESDRKQFDSPNAIMNLTGNIYAELRVNRTIEYLRSVANGEAEAEVEQESDAPEPQDTSEEPSDEAQAAGDETISSEVEEESESEDIGSIDSEPDVTEDESPETEGEKDTDG
jgi:trigger factor